MKQTIVLLHGWIASKENFLSSEHKYTRLITGLQKKGFGVFAPDMPGFGNNANITKPFYLDDYARFLDTFLHKNSITTPILIGHSFGGRVALAYNRLYPGRVKTIIVSGTPGFSPVPKAKLVLFLAVAKIGGIIFSLPFIRFLKNKVRLWYYWRINARDYYRAEGYMRQTFKNVVRENLTSCMRIVTVPTLLLWGKCDALVPWAIGKKMQGIIRGSSMIGIPDAGHSVLETHPDVCVTAIASYIAKL